jgi:hypothetical protein
VRRGLLAGVAFVLAGLALAVARRAAVRRSLAWARQRGRARLGAWACRGIVRRETTSRLAAEERRILALFGCPPAGTDVDLEGGYFCPAAEKYAAKS